MTYLFSETADHISRQGDSGVAGKNSSSMCKPKLIKLAELPAAASW